MKNERLNEIFRRNTDMELSALGLLLLIGYPSGGIILLIDGANKLEHGQANGFWEMVGGIILAGVGTESWKKINEIIYKLHLKTLEEKRNQSN